MVAGHLWDVVKHLWELGDDPYSRFAELAFWRRGPKMVLFVNYTKSWFLFTSTSMMSLMSRPADTQPEGRVADVASNNQSFFNNLNFEFKWWFTSSLFLLGGKTKQKVWQHVAELSLYKMVGSLFPKLFSSLKLNWWRFKVSCLRQRGKRQSQCSCLFSLFWKQKEKANQSIILLCSGKEECYEGMSRRHEKKKKVQPHVSLIKQQHFRRRGLGILKI